MSQGEAIGHLRHVIGGVKKDLLRRQLLDFGLVLLDGFLLAKQSRWVLVKKNRIRIVVMIGCIDLQVICIVWIKEQLHVTLLLTLRSSQNLKSYNIPYHSQQQRTWEQKTGDLSGGLHHKPWDLIKHQVFLPRNIKLTTTNPKSDLRCFFCLKKSRCTIAAEPKGRLLRDVDLRNQQGPRRKNRRLDVANAARHGGKKVSKIGRWCPL